MRAVPVLLAIAAVIDSGCSTITVVDRDGVAKIERRLGVTMIRADPSGTVIAEGRSLGFISSPAGNTLGYSDVSIGAFDNECRLVFWVKDAAEYRKILAQAGKPESACIGPGIKKEQ
jgi:hypothetical protein